ncbi:MAG: hypothetical protein WED33_01950 [Bacteroidia bacterium]
MRFLTTFFSLIVLFSSCKKDSSELIPDNDAPPYSKVSSVKIRNYVNRLFIDLIGREPLDDEMALETYTLQQSNADFTSREALVRKIMFDSTFRQGDTSYSLSYFKRIYELNKIRLLEGVSDQALEDEAQILRSNAISDSLSFNQAGYDENMDGYNKLVNVLTSDTRLKSGEISIQEQLNFMLQNKIYDVINMNSFNFVNAAFNDLLFRFPTQNEFSIGFAMVEDNVAGNLFNRVGQTKADFSEIVSQSNECTQGVIIWSYVTILAREPNSQELYQELQTYGMNKNLQELQIRLLISNEYTNF